MSRNAGRRRTLSYPRLRYGARTKEHTLVHLVVPLTSAEIEHVRELASATNRSVADALAQFIYVGIASDQT